MQKNQFNLGVYNVKQKTIPARLVTQRNICFYIHDNHFCVIRKTAHSTYPVAIKELKDKFKYESNEISDVFFEQVIEYEFPISYEENCMFALVALDLETCSVENQLNCEFYGAGVYHLNRSNKCFNGDLIEKELEIEKQHVQVFD